MINTRGLVQSVCGRLDHPGSWYFRCSCPTDRRASLEYASVGAYAGSAAEIHAGYR